MPHSRYDQNPELDILNRFMTNFMDYRVVVGRNFNTTLNNNRRVDLMIDLVHAFDSVIGDYRLVNTNA